MIFYTPQNECSYMGKGMTPFGFYSYVSRLDSVDTPFL